MLFLLSLPPELSVIGPIFVRVTVSLSEIPSSLNHLNVFAMGRMFGPMAKALLAMSICRVALPGLRSQLRFQAPRPVDAFPKEYCLCSWTQFPDPGCSLVQPGAAWAPAGTCQVKEQVDAIVCLLTYSPCPLPSVFFLLPSAFYIKWKPIH